MEASPADVTCVDPIDTLDSKESVLEEDTEPAGDLHDVILDKRGEGQPHPIRGAANSVMDPLAEAVAGVPSPDAATLHMEQGPEQADGLRNVILDKRGEGQPCPVRRATDSVIDTWVEAVANAPSQEAAMLPTEGALSKPMPTLPTSSQTETPETQDLNAEDTVVLLHKEEMTVFP